MPRVLSLNDCIIYVRRDGRPSWSHQTEQACLALPNRVLSRLPVNRTLANPPMSDGDVDQSLLPSIETVCGRRSDR
jgi:hypothetical protein